MDIRYFESLLSVAELGSIAEAARSQMLTPAAVGQRIAALEKHFGVRLLDRTAQRAKPTRACESILTRARQLVGDFHDLSRLATADQLVEQLHLGAISTALTGMLPAAMRRLSEVAPSLSLQVTPGTSKSLFDDLEQRRIDAAILCLPPHPLPDQFEQHVLRKEPLVFLSRDAVGRSVREKLEQNPYICYDPNSWGGAGAVAYLEDHSLDITPVYELDALEAIERLVKEGMGVSLVPHWAGLGISSKSLQSQVVKNTKYQRRVALVAPRLEQRQRSIQVLLEAFAASV